MICCFQAIIVINIFPAILHIEDAAGAMRRKSTAPITRPSTDGFQRWKCAGGIQQDPAGTCRVGRRSLCSYDRFGLHARTPNRLQTGSEFRNGKTTDRAYGRRLDFQSTYCHRCSWTPLLLFMTCGDVSDYDGAEFLADYFQNGTPFRRSWLRCELVPCAAGENASGALY